MQSLSIIIPCFNEGEKLILNIEKVKKYLNENFSNLKYEIITVNDGSTDKKTNDIFYNTKIDNVIFFSYEKNRGKGFAVKKGIELASNDIVLFMDADLSTDITAIKTVFDNIKQSDIVIGSRHHKETYIPNPQPAYRQIMGYSCISITKILTGLNVKDTQCGFKAFKKHIAKELIKKQRINRWAFDVEYLYIAHLNNYSIKEIPIIWCNDDESTVSPIKSSISFFKELVTIKNNKKYYI